MWRPFCHFFATFLHVHGEGGGAFWACPPSLQKFLQAPCSGVVGNFSCGSLSWHGHISYRYRSRGGGGACMNGRLLRVKIHIQTWGVYL